MRSCWRARSRCSLAQVPVQKQKCWVAGYWRRGQLQYCYKSCGWVYILALRIAVPFSSRGSFRESSTPLQLSSPVFQFSSPVHWVVTAVNSFSFFFLVVVSHLSLSMTLRSDCQGWSMFKADPLRFALRARCILPIESASIPGSSALNSRFTAKKVQRPSRRRRYTCCSPVLLYMYLRHLVIAQQIWNWCTFIFIVSPSLIDPRTTTSTVMLTLLGPYTTYYTFSRHDLIKTNMVLISSAVQTDSQFVNWEVMSTRYGRQLSKYNLKISYIITVHSGLFCCLCKEEHKCKIFLLCIL